VGGAESRATALEETLPSNPGGDALGEGSKVDRYDVQERVGAGGMGVVYRAYDPELRREVALKLLKAGLRVGQAASKRRKRLLREARAMAQLSHPNVIPVYDVGEYGDGLYVAMEFVEGQNARDWLATVKPPWRRALGVFRAAGRGLAAAHNAGLVHRDFKPANVLVGDDGRVRVLDFGLARAVIDEPELDVDASAERREEPESGGHWSETLTADGTILGTPVYMAPEQYAGKPADARSDQYSYCIALFEALYGRLPFATGSIKQQARAKHRGEIADAPTDSPVPTRLYYVLRRGLSTKPANRFASMPDLLRELRTVHEDRAAPAPRRAWPMIAGVVAVTATTLLIGALARPDPAIEPNTCLESAEALGKAWDEPQRETLRQAFIRSDVVGASDRWAEVEERIDARAQAWNERWSEACRTPSEGSRARRLQQARLACLERHRANLAAFVTVLDDPSAVVIHRAAAAVQGLPPMEDCEDDHSLLVSAERDALRREQIAPLVEGIGRARALRTTGRPDAARREIDEVIERAGANDLRAVSGRALLERAQLERSTDDLAAAELDLRAAYFNAIADRHARVAATAAIALVDLLAARGNTEDALLWSEHAGAHLDALGEAAGLDAALRQALASVGKTSPKDDTEP